MFTVFPFLFLSGWNRLPYFPYNLNNMIVSWDSLIKLMETYLYLFLDCFFSFCALPPYTIGAVSPTKPQMCCEKRRRN